MKFIITTFFIIAKIVCYSQISAVTTDGDEVVLYDDGTWKYISKEEEADIQVNNTKFSKSSSATFALKSKISNAIINLDVKKWSFTKGEEGDAVEYNFRMKDKETAYGLLITERIEMPLETLKKIAFKNARSAAPDITIVKQDYRIVNGYKIFFMQMDGTIEGMKISYLGYYYSSPLGTIQFLTYTSQNLLNDYQADLINLLNGIELK